MSEKSQYRDSKKVGLRGMSLEWNQELVGCKEGFEHNGKKISAEVYQLIPEKSILRNLNPEEIIVDYNNTLDLTPR